MTQELYIVATTLTLYAIAVASPGPNFALVSRLAISGSRRAATSATFGLALAATLYAVLTMTGLALVLSQIGWLATLIQIAGGCYLVYLGLKAWFARAPLAAGNGDQGSPGAEMARGFRMGIIVNLSNPKVITFFVSLYAVTVPSDTALWAKLAILAGGFMLEILWYGMVILLLSTAPARRSYQRFGRWIERLIGTALAAFGVRLLAEKL